MPWNRNFIAAARGLFVLLLTGAVSVWIATPGVGAEPIRIGLSVALTGALSGGGKQVLAGLDIWRNDVNGKGGLLGRPVELVYYDSQSNPNNEPVIYSKLIDVDKVDLIVGPYASNQVSAAVPAIMQRNKMTIAVLANAANAEYRYPKYFSMNPTGPRPKLSFSNGFLELALAGEPRPKTIAITGADAEFSRNAIDGLHDNLKGTGLRVVYDKSYPINTTDFNPIIRAIQAAAPDIVYVASYPIDSVGIVRAVSEVGLKTNVFGGAMIGLLYTNFKMQLGPLMNGIINQETFAPSSHNRNPALDEMLSKYRAIAQRQGIDALGYGYAPFGYATGQIVADAVAATNSLDQDVLAAHIHKTRFQTLIGEIAFGPEGEWVEQRVFFTQYQNITGNGLDQFIDRAHEVILWPAAHKTGNIIYPFTSARK
jgi:branched-chain amino acid transport system substrate-binding protein